MLLCEKKNSSLLKKVRRMSTLYGRRNPNVDSICVYLLKRRFDVAKRRRFNVDISRRLINVDIFRRLSNVDI